MRRRGQVAGDEREVVDGSDGGSTLGRVVDAHGPADEGGFGTAIEGAACSICATLRAR